MLIVALGWLFVVGLYAVAHATAPQGTLLGALGLLVFVGLLPLALVLYVMGAPARRRRQAPAPAIAPGPSAADPDGGSHAPGDAVAPKREEA